MKIVRFISEKLNFLACPACNNGNGHGINDLCDDCRFKLLFFGNNVCYSCGGELDGVLSCCTKCMKEEKRPFLEAASVFAYSSYGRELILKYKSEHILPFARIFARMAAERIRSNYAHWQFDMVVPVPLHWSRKFSRTFNQSELLAEFLGKELLSPVAAQALSRTKRTKSQKFLSGTERHKNLRDAFKANPEIVKNKKVLLLDDVFTTGATLSCAAEALMNAGAECVYVLSIARA
ncbi:MAG: ComF family protein [Lentisphaeria bacterium]|nr:ComF family protein [Lentisphaeria bacterium]